VFRMLLTEPVPCRDETGEIGCCPAGHEDATRIRTEANQVADPSQRLVLGEHGAGAFKPRAGVDARRRHRQVEQRGCLGRCGGHESEEPGMIDGEARLAEHVLPQSQNGISAEAMSRNRVPGSFS
jgi:hypothetical protein